MFTQSHLMQPITFTEGSAWREGCKKALDFSFELLAL